MYGNSKVIGRVRADALQTEQRAHQFEMSSQDAEVIVMGMLSQDIRPTNDQQLAPLLEWLDASQREVANGADKRRSKRRRLRLPCQIHYVAPGGGEILYTLGRARNVSKLGVGLIVSMPFAAGTEVRLAFELENHRRVSLTGCVVFSRPTHLNWYTTGVRFETPEDTRLIRISTPGGNP